jgi:hypothetical protein
VSFWENFWDVIWWLFVAYAFIAFLYAVFAVIGDLFGDHKVSGWLKAVWMIFLIFIPFLTVLVYMVVRGKGMAQRSREASKIKYESAQAYIREVATINPSEEISKAQALLDSGAISDDEFARIKSTVQV